MKIVPLTSLGLAMAFLFFVNSNISEYPGVPENLFCDCIIDLGEDIEIELGDSIKLEPQISCQPQQINSIAWSGASGISCPDCFETFVRPLEDVCYTISIEWLDGCTSTEEICVSVGSCDVPFSENKINSITPQQINDQAEIEIEIARTQYVYLEIVENDEVQHTLWEGWMNAGLRTKTLDFSDVSAGTHELRARLYPENKSITIEKL